MNGLNFSFPFFPSDSQNLNVIVPTLDPGACMRTFGQKNDDNSLPEEIFPDFRCKECLMSIPTYSEFRAHLSMHDVKNNEIAAESSFPCFENVERMCKGKSKPSILEPLIAAESSFPCFENVERMCKGKSKPSILEPLKLGAVDGESSCPKKFRFNPELTDHVNGHHGIINTEDISCLICKCAFASVRTLHKHVEMIHCVNKGRRQCPYCTYRCFQSSDLDKHIARRHTRDFKYKCLHCVKGFATPKELKNHERRKHFEMLEAQYEKIST